MDRLDVVAGRIDFPARAWETEPGGTLWVGRSTYEPAQSGGGWEAKELIDDGSQLPLPLGLVEALLGVVNARSEGAAEAQGAPAERLRCVVDLVEADARSPAGIAPISVVVADVRAVELSLVLDAEDRVRRMEFDTNEMQMWIELWEFGEPPAIEVPGPARAAEVAPLQPEPETAERVRAGLVTTAARGPVGFTMSAHTRMAAAVGEPLVTEGRLDLTTGDYEIEERGQFEGAPRQSGRAAAPTGSGPWLLGLLHGVTAAVGAGREDVEGTTAERFECRVDVIDADRSAPRGVQLESHLTIRAQHALLLTVWLDDEGGISRVAYAGPQQALVLDVVQPPPISS
jgi:hypothetical protein